MKRQEKLTWLCTRNKEGDLVVNVKLITPFPEDEESLIDITPLEGSLEDSNDPDELIVFPNMDSLRVYQQQLKDLNPLHGIIEL